VREKIIRLLLIEDDEDDFILARDLLDDVRTTRYAIEWADNYDDGLTRLRTLHPDVCLLDFNLDGRTGLDLLHEALARGCDVPIIFLTGQAGREFDVEAMRSGAADYLVKGQYTSAHLERTIRYALERSNTLGTLRELNEELRLAHTQAMRASHAKSMFLATMSHEFRTPLNAILGYSELIEEELTSDEEPEFPRLLTDLRKISHAGRHLLSLVNDILDLGKIEAGKFDIIGETFALEPFLAEQMSALRPLAERNRNTLRIECEGSLGDVHLDPVRLRQAVLNVLSNACKFTQHGVVTLRARRFVGLIPGARANKQDERESRELVELTIHDTGIGMTAEQLQRLFISFSQADSTIARRFGGSGLGLSICRRLCRLMGGEVFVESEFGRGSQFRLVLPVDLRKQIQREAKAANAPRPGAGATVIIAGRNKGARDDIDERVRVWRSSLIVDETVEAALGRTGAQPPAALVVELNETSERALLEDTRLDASPYRRAPLLLYTLDESGQFGRVLGPVQLITRPLEDTRLVEVTERLIGDRGRPLSVGSNADGLTREACDVLARAGWNATPTRPGREALRGEEAGAAELYLLDVAQMPEPALFESPPSRAADSRERAPMPRTLLVVPGQLDDGWSPQLHAAMQTKLRERGLPRKFLLDRIDALLRELLIP